MRSVVATRAAGECFQSFFECFYLTNRFHVAVRLFSNRSQMTSKCGKNKKVAHKAQPSVSLMFLPHFDVICDLLLNRRTATWNLFVKQKHEWKFERTRNAVGTRAAGECFHRLFRVLPNFHECFFNSIETQSTCFLFLLENTATRLRKTTCKL